MSVAEKTRSIVLKVPERAVALLERIAEREHITLKAFLEHRVADLVRYAASQRPARRLQASNPAEKEEDPLPGQYL